MEMITTKQASNILGVSERRIRQLIDSGKLQAVRVGRDWVINKKSLAEVRIYGKAGRPKIHKEVSGSNR